MAVQAFYYDRIQETTATTGTGTVTLNGAVTGYATFSSVCVTGQRVFYTMFDGVNWEVGVGTYTTSGDTFARQQVLASSNAGALVNFPGPNTAIWVDEPAAGIANIGMAAAFAMHLAPQ